MKTGSFAGGWIVVRQRSAKSGSTILSISCAGLTVGKERESKEEEGQKYHDGTQEYYSLTMYEEDQFSSSFEILPRPRSQSNILAL